LVCEGGSRRLDVRPAGKVKSSFIVIEKIRFFAAFATRVEECFA